MIRTIIFQAARLVFIIAGIYLILWAAQSLYDLWGLVGVMLLLFCLAGMTLATLPDRDGYQPRPGPGRPPTTGSGVRRDG